MRKVINLFRYKASDYGNRLKEIKDIQRYYGVYQRALYMIDHHLSNIEVIGDDLEVKNFLEHSGKNLNIISLKLKKREEKLRSELKRLEQSLYTHPDEERNK